MIYTDSNPFDPSANETSRTVTETPDGTSYRTISPQGGWMEELDRDDVTDAVTSGAVVAVVDGDRLAGYLVAE